MMSQHGWIIIAQGIRAFLVLIGVGLMFCFGRSGFFRVKGDD